MMSGPRRAERSDARPEPNFTNAAASSAAPSSVPRATAPAPNTPVTNAGSSGYTISLAKSLSSETNPKSATGRGSLPTEAQAPADQGDGEAPIRQDRVVERTQGEGTLASSVEVLAQPQQLAPPDRVAELVARRRAVAAHFVLCVGALQMQLAHHHVDRLLDRHPPRMQPDVEQYPHCPPQQVHALEEPLFLLGVEPLLRHHVLAIERPPLDGERRRQVLAHVRRLRLGLHQVQVMAGKALVQGGPRQLVAAMVPEHALTPGGRQRGIRHRHVEP